MSILTSQELRKLAKRVVDLEKEALYGEGETEDQRLNNVEKVLIEESRRINPQ
ncbi:MAG: hypothetical protein HIU91_09605 [Acidobacteria bacterium]|nr:hypothetical protein [Acidobacteriota bacterium]